MAEDQTKMEETPGTSGEWFLRREAECSDDGDSDEEIEASAESEQSDLIDNSQVSQGNSLRLFQEQERAHDERILHDLKRKHFSSPNQKVDVDLSPGIRAITITPEKQPPKRRLFVPESDSGVELSIQNEVDTFLQEKPSQVTESDTAAVLDCAPNGRREETEFCLADEILKSSNRQATLLAKFKDFIGVSFMELTRSFRNNKTCSGTWVVAVFQVMEDLFEASKTILQSHCHYYNIARHVTERGSMCLMLLSFKVNKSRETVENLFKNILQVEAHQILSNPTRLRSSITALYWFKTAFSPVSTVYGETPEWLKRQTVIGHQTAQEQSFSLTEMVQWAMDNDINDEPTLAFEYAKAADEISNAQAWLNTNNQAKLVKEAITMVRLYRTAQMRQMSMSEWLHERCKRYKKKEGEWKSICYFLRYQGVEVPVFIESLKLFLKGVPKKTCFVIQGPSNTGKSMLTLSLCKFMGGTVLSFVNMRSHFWISPMANAKVVMIDDATDALWDYFDTYMRNAMDGTEVSIDMKYKHPVQIKCPPMLITTNVDITTNDRWRYLQSRATIFKFPNEMPMTETGEPLYLITECNWQSFFERLWSQLELSDQEEEGDGDPVRSFRVCSRRTADAL